MDLSLNNLALVIFLSLSLSFCLFPGTVLAKLRKNYYHKTCPNVENIVRDAVTKKFQQTFVTAPATIRLFFHDCFVQGCDASVMIASSGGNKAEKDHPDNFSLAGDGFDTVIKAKEAVDAVPSCRNKVSCADILAMATRDAIALLGGPYYEVEQGRLDGLSSTAAAHTVGFSHCSKFANRIHNFSRLNAVDPALDRGYASRLRQMCPKNVDTRVAVDVDVKTPRKFDNVYFKNLQKSV
ncbi:Peroxidase 73 [Hibiscus syriacus]|uniref:peroxidase n=1 Tax=Hibiscus syriacus TaxID=106335 RepID=A0A6A3AA54_HIBSY|nr:Peroxidase 73 [Hibiscus syriacus]